MARTTVAEVVRLYKIQGDLIAGLEADVRSLRAGEVKLLDSHNAAQLDAARDREQLAQARKELEAERAVARQRDRELSDLRTEHALLRQKLDDHLKRVEVGDARRWTLIGLFVAAILSFAGNLVATLIKK